MPDMAPNEEEQVAGEAEAMTEQLKQPNAVESLRRIGFLDLPAEIRNRVYYLADEGLHEVFRADSFAKERDSNVIIFHLSERHIPTTTVHRPTNKGPWPIANLGRSSFKFFGLTQVCRQVRAEYRPLWGRSAFFRIHYEQFASFMRTFYGSGQPHVVEAPTRLEISWDPVVPSHAELLPFIKLRIHNPSTKIVIPHELAECNNVPKELTEPCKECGHQGSARTWVFCEHLEDRVHGWHSGVNEKYRYLRLFNKLIAHKKGFWEADILSNFITDVTINKHPDWYTTKVLLSHRLNGNWPMCNLD